MAQKRGPTLRAQWLGQQLYEARTAAKLRMVDAAEYLLRDQGSISRWESGSVPPKPADVMALLNLYGVDDLAQRDALERLSRDTWRKGWWDGFSGQIADDFIDYAWLEDRAISIRMFSALVIPGLLQTRAYAKAVIRVFDADATEAQIERGLQFRVSRQELLARDDTPRLQVILDEALLRRPVGGAKAMRAQLDHLSELSRRKAVELRVLPFSAGAHAGQQGAFQIFEQPDPFAEVAYAETLAGSNYVESDKVDRFIRAYAQIHQASLSLEKSAALLRSAAKELA